MLNRKSFKQVISITRPNECLARIFLPEIPCNKLINPHSIQNNGVLSFVASGFQTLLHRRFESGIQHDNVLNGFERLGRSQATTFGRGMCGNHDKEIFACIEDRKINLGNGKQLLTFAIKSYLKEKYVKKHALDVANVMVGIGNFASYGYEQANDFLKRTEKILCAAYQENNTDFETVSFVLDSTFRIAVSSMISPWFGFCGEVLNEDALQPKTCCNLFVTVQPDIENNKTYILLGFLKQDKEVFGEMMAYLQLLDGASFKKAISALVIVYCQNMVVTENILKDDELVGVINEIIDEIGVTKAYDLHDPMYLHSVIDREINLFSNLTEFKIT